MRVLALAAAAVSAASLLVAPGPAAAGVELVPPFPPGRYADAGAIGLAVPGAGPTVTRESARNALLTGAVRSSILGGTPPGDAKLALGADGTPHVYVVLPPPGTSENDRRYPIAAVGEGFRGVLTSDSTRIAGLVSITDVANGRLRSVEVDDPVATLQRLDERIKRNERIRLPLELLLVAATIAAAFVRPRLAPRIVLVALAANLWLAGWWLVVPLAALAAVLPLPAASAAILVSYLAAMGIDAELVALSPLGPSQAGRFFGVSNLLETLLLLPALLGAALAGRAAALVAALALVTVGGNRFGADGGGLLVLLAGYGVLWLRLRGVRLTVRRTALLGAGAVACGLALVALDALLGGASHVTDALSSGPSDLFSDLADRLELSLRRTLAGPGPLVSALASLAGLTLVATRLRRGPATDAVLAALAVSLVVNDTPVDVLGLGCAVALAVARFEAVALPSPRRR